MLSPDSGSLTHESQFAQSSWISPHKIHTVKKSPEEALFWQREPRGGTVTNCNQTSHGRSAGSLAPQSRRTRHRTCLHRHVAQHRADMTTSANCAPPALITEGSSCTTKLSRAGVIRTRRGGEARAVSPRTARGEASRAEGVSGLAQEDQRRCVSLVACKQPVPAASS